MKNQATGQLIFFLVSLLALLIVVGCQTSTETAIIDDAPNIPSETQDNFVEEETMEVEETEEENVNVVIISNYFLHDCFVGIDSYPCVVGEVQNNGNSNVEFVKVIGSFTDNDGNFLGSESAYSKLDVLLPSQKSPFELRLTDARNEWSGDVELQVQASMSSENPYTHFKIINDNGKALSADRYKVIGQIKNTGSELKEFVKVVGTFYTHLPNKNKDLVIGTEFTYTEIEKLEPGQTSPFEMTLTDVVAEEITSYQLQVQSN